MAELRKGGLIEKALRIGKGYCQVCGNLVRLSDNALACAASDKLIMPTRPPYSETNRSCKDWVKVEG